jgi:hypothetical protein
VAPPELVVATGYGAWNDYLADLFLARSPADVPRHWDVPAPIGADPVQVCLPVLRMQWVREIRPLPRRTDGATERFARA